MKVIGSGTLTDCIAWDADLKSHLRVVGDDDEDLVTIYIKAVTQYIMKYTGLPLFYATITTYNDSMAYTLELPRIAGTISCIDILSDNEWTAWDYDYTVEDYGTNKCIRSSYINYNEEYRITTSVSLSTADTNLIKMVAYLLIGEMYENREDRPERFMNKSARLLDTITMMA
jgi:hypothetical protein